ncbi:MAG: hypothetical protein P4L81_02295 [Candidatus Pacebacteria bacterium]|nr:hypothetical protein [Candidatus Paceibacterota bacterium]
MHWRNTYLLASAIPPVLLCPLLFAFVFQQFPLAWTYAFIIVLAMETRAQTGDRVDRTTIFWTHLSAAIPFFVALSVLAFVTHPQWLMLLTAAAGIAAFYTGGILWYRGLQARMLH